MLLAVLVLSVAAGCTSRTKEVIKEQYVITDVICDRLDDAQKQPTKEELYGFVVATRDTFDTLKKKGKSISIAIYSKSVTMSNRIAAKEDIDYEELKQFVKSARDTYKILLEEKK
jgi:hypothetical protein